MKRDVGATLGLRLEAEPSASDQLHLGCIAVPLEMYATEGLADLLSHEVDIVNILAEQTR